MTARKYNELFYVGRIICRTNQILHRLDQWTLYLQIQLQQQQQWILK